MELLLKLDQRIEASPYFLPTVLVFFVALLVYLRGRSLIRYAIIRWTPARASRRRLDGVAGFARIHGNAAPARKVRLEESSFANAARICRGDSCRRSARAGDAVDRALPVLALRQPPGTRRPDVFSPSLHSRIAPNSQASRGCKRSSRLKVPEQSPSSSDRAISCAIWSIHLGMWNNLAPC